MFLPGGFLFHRGLAVAANDDQRGEGDQADEAPAYRVHVLFEDGIDPGPETVGRRLAVIEAGLRRVVDELAEAVAVLCHVRPLCR